VAGAKKNRIGTGLSQAPLISRGQQPSGPRFHHRTTSITGNHSMEAQRELCKNTAKFARSIGRTRWARAKRPVPCHVIHFINSSSSMIGVFPWITSSLARPMTGYAIVPEPSTVLLFSGGLFTILIASRVRRRKERRFRR